MGEELRSRASQRLRERLALLRADAPAFVEAHLLVLGLYGGLDKGIPQADVDAMKAALKAAGKTGSDIIVYPNAQHGFLADYRPSYNATDAAAGWAALLAHFKKNGVG